MTISSEMQRILALARRSEASDIHIVAGLPPLFRINGEIILADASPLNREDTKRLCFSLLNEEQQKVFEEIWRVLQPGGHLRLWEIDLAERPDTDKEIYIVQLRYRVGEYEVSTGYGQRWPEEMRNRNYYIELAKNAGFQLVESQTNKHTFYLLLQKPKVWYIQQKKM